MTSIPATGAAGTLNGLGGLDTAAAATYTDMNGLSVLKRDPDSPQALAAVARQVEALFLQMMLKSMRDATTAESENSNEMGMYQDMFDKQVALSLSQHVDLGIGKLLKRQSPSKSAALAAPGATAPSTAAPATTMPAGASASGAPAPGASAPGASAAAQTHGFLQQVLPAIQTAAAALGIHPLGLLSQAALESGWGQRVPRKADAAWHGGKAAADTIEVIGGVATARRAAFRAYGSIEEGVHDFAKLLQTSPRYHEALQAGTDAQAYITSIGRSGYATDPNYADKLTQVLHSAALRAAPGSVVPRSAL